MSWSVSKTVLGSSYKDELQELKVGAISQNSTCEDQFEAAKDAVYILISSDSLGTSDKEYYVTMSGHSNPNHEHRDGWANDCITVSVSQK